MMEEDKMTVESSTTVTDDEIQNELDWLIQQDENLNTPVNKTTTDQNKNRGMEDFFNNLLSKNVQKTEQDDHQNKIKDNDTEISENSQIKLKSSPNNEDKESENSSIQPSKQVSYSSETEDEKGQREARETKSNTDEGQQSDSDINHDDDDYTLTDDQRQAMIELDKMKQELEYPYEDAPEYDVRERLVQLNAELANDPDMPDDREFKVGFKDNLVDLVVPPPEYSDNEDDGDNTTKGGTDNETSSSIMTETNISDSQLASEVQPVSDEPSVDAEPNQTDNSVADQDVRGKDESETPREGGDSSKKVLIERDGKFELVRSDQLQADGDGFGLSPELYNLPKDEETEVKDEANEEKIESSSEQQMFAPSPPSEPRPATATGYTRHTTPKLQNRAHSAHASSRYEHDRESYAENYRSPYGLTPQQKELKKQKEKLLLEQKKKEQDEKVEDERQKREENESAFQAWLNSKRKEAEESHQQDDKKDDSESQNKSTSEGDTRSGHSDDYNEDDSKQAFDEWLKEKKRVQRKDIDIERERQQELKSMYFIREREECEKAFKQWLKKKNSEKRMEIQLTHQKARIQSLASRRSRKSQALARAIRQAQAFRYVDYYGYRF